MKRIFVLLAFIVSLGAAEAQTADSPWWLSLDLTNNKFKFRYWEGLYDFGDLGNAGFRVGVERYLNRSFDLELGFAYGNLVYENLFDANVADLGVRFAYKLDNGYLLKEESKIAPYVFLGTGYSWLSNIGTGGSLIFQEFDGNSFGMVNWGVGLKLKATEDAEINARANYQKSYQDSPDYMQYSIGVSFSLGGDKDSDKDGVLDKEDPCPQEAGPVENNGCPWPDTDGDGVLDKDDQCPTEAGTINGCPDKDGDGIKDSEDSCPDVAGIAAFNGCPDSDNDGVQDSEDECPNVAGTLNGCPDSDNDGVKDSEDACPNQAGTLNGCPDGDGDGVRDGDDQCPETAGAASNNGCPVVEEEVQKVLELAVKNIQFNSNSDVLKTSSYSSLNEVAQLMKENSFDLKLSGYTDNTGRAEYNLELSERRANAVKQYLINQGVEENRLSADGYGIINPVADNGTAAGRAANRRVELEIVFR